MFLLNATLHTAHNHQIMLAIKCFSLRTCGHTSSIPFVVALGLVRVRVRGRIRVRGRVRVRVRVGWG